MLHLSQQEQTRVVKDFYKHFCDLIVESLRLFSMPKEELLTRLNVSNPEIFVRYVDDSQSVLVVGGHYGNWEMLAVASNIYVPHQVIGIYTPLSNRFMAGKMSASRAKYGVVLKAKKEVKEFFESRSEGLYAMFFGSDQSPSKGRKAYEMTFLNRPTRVQFGLEKYAVEHDLPVLYFDLAKVKRGHYQATFQIVAENSANTSYGEITERHVRLLEAQIMRAPAYWLWSHRRWKGMDHVQ